jgi:hypothetical protein
MYFRTKHMIFKYLLAILSIISSWWASGVLLLRVDCVLFSGVSSADVVILPIRF